MSIGNRPPLKVAGIIKWRHMPSPEDLANMSRSELIERRDELVGVLASHGLTGNETFFGDFYWGSHEYDQLNVPPPEASEARAEVARINRMLGK